MSTDECEQLLLQLETITIQPLVCTCSL